MKTLECSSVGDKRYSAFFAHITVFGKEDSIENHYQLSKRFWDEKPPTHWKTAKGRLPTHIELNGQQYETRFLTQWYKLLWLMYLDTYPDLVAYAAQFDEFTDKFRGTALNCQADIIKQYVKQGRKSVLDDCIELLELLKKGVSES